MENLRQIFQVSLSFGSSSNDPYNITLQVSPSEAWLRDDVDGSVYFPQPDGSFSLQDAGVSPYASLVVEGPNALQLPRSNLPPHAAVQLLCHYAVHQDQVPLSTPGFRSVVTSKRAPSFNLKIIKAKMIKARKKIEFKPIHQTFIELVESTANVDHILGVIQRKWGTNYIIVTQDGLKLEEGPGTQGIVINCN